MHRTSQEKKISRAICDHDLVSMQQDHRLEMRRNSRERKRGKVVSDRDFDLREGTQRGEMYRTSQEKTGSRSRSGERKEIRDVDLDVTERAQIEGTVQLRKQENKSKITLDFTPGIRASVEGSSSGLEFKHASSKKSSRTPIKALIDNGMSHEKEIKRSSPSLLARLMGLDALPPGLSKQKKEIGISSQKTSSVKLHEKHASLEGYPLHTCNSEYEECKDVYEVVEMPMVQKHYDKRFQKGMSRLEQSEVSFKPCNSNQVFSKQPLMDAAHLSTDDEFHYFEENDDTLEALDPSKDIFVKFLQEPNSLFKKHLQDLKCSPPSPHASHITILKPSKFAKADNELCYYSEKNAERCSKLLKDDKSFAKKHISKLAGYSVKEDSRSLPHILSESLYAGKTKVHHQPTQIVVLKPSLEKGWDKGPDVLVARSPENFHYDLKRQKRVPSSRRSEVCARRRDRLELPENVGKMGHKEKELRDIAREITKQLRAAKSSCSKMEVTSKKYAYNGNESMRGVPGMENCDDLSTSSYYSAESSVSREARKNLSQRWKMMHNINGEEPVDKGSSTLGEMLVSDRDMPRNTLNSSIILNVSDKVATGEAFEKWEFPLGIRSREGWQEGWSRNLSRSESPPDSLLFYGNSKPSKRNRVGFNDNSYLRSGFNKSPNNYLVKNVDQRRSSIQSLKHYPGGDESEMSEREIHVNSEESDCRIHPRHFSEAICTVPELINDPIVGRNHEGGNLASHCEDVNFPLIIDDSHVQHSTKMEMPVNDGDFSTTNPKYVARKETLADHPQVNSGASQCEISESPSPVSFKEDHPSPVSVLKLPPSEEDRSCSECFQKISADLKELRMQLRLLKLESADTDDEDLELIVSSDEDIEGDHHFPCNSEPILKAFRDDEDRDFSYLLDVLTDSGTEPVGKQVFEKLEKKYSALPLWSRSDRMLLFDLVTSIAADTIAVKSRKPCPTLAHETLVDEVWLLVTKQRGELSRKMESKLILEQKWLDVGDDVDIIRKELETMLFNDLIEEFR